MNNELSDKYLDRKAKTMRWHNFVGAIAGLLFVLFIFSFLSVFNGWVDFTFVYTVMGIMSIFWLSWVVLVGEVGLMNSSIDDIEYVALTRLASEHKEALFGKTKTADLVRAEMRYGKINRYALRKLLLPFFGVETMSYWRDLCRIAQGAVREDLATVLKVQESRE